MARSYISRYPEQDRGAVAREQFVTSQGPLILTGSPVIFSGFSSSLTISAFDGGDWTSIGFTVVGTDANGAQKTEIYGGPNDDTIFLTDIFGTISSITVDGFVAGSEVSVGTGEVGFTDWLPMNLNSTFPGFSVQTMGAGSFTYTIEKTLFINQGYNRPDVPIVAFPFDSTQVELTKDSYLTSFGSPISAIRANFSETPTAGEVYVIVNQQGIT